METHYFIAANGKDLEKLLEDLVEVLAETKTLRQAYDDVRYTFEDSECKITFGFRDEDKES